MLHDSSLDISIGARDADTLFGETHLVCKGAVRYPFGAVTSISLLHHLINLLQAQALCLRDKEVGKGKGQAAERTPKEEDFGAKIRVARAGADEIGGDDGDDLRV